VLTKQLPAVPTLNVELQPTLVHLIAKETTLIKTTLHTHVTTQEQELHIVQTIQLHS
jgi:hypothetical protein